MEKGFFKRLKGVLALAMCALMVVGTVIPANAEEGNYSYTCCYYSHAGTGSTYNILGDYIIRNNGVRETLDSKSITFGTNQIYDYKISERNLDFKVLEGGQKLQISIGKDTTESDLGNKVVINIKEGSSLLATYGFDVTDSEEMYTPASITIGTSGNYYVWTFDESSIVKANNGKEYYAPKSTSGTDSKTYTWDMQFEQVYKISYSSVDFYIREAYYDVSSNKYYKAGDTVSFSLNSGALYGPAEAHIQVKKYSGNTSDYEILSNESLGLPKDTKGSGSFTMPEGNVELSLVLDTTNLSTPDYVNRYKTAAKAATCTEAGNIEYVQCPSCERYFVLEENEWKIKSAEEVYCIPATNHDSKTNVAAKAASCTEDGNIEYWYCQDCNKYFSDEACTQEISLEDTKVVSGNHQNLKKIAAKASTCTANGNIEYYKCDDCNVLFADAAAKKAITIQETVVAKANHDYEVKTVAATAKADGESYKECKVCKAVADREVIAKPIVTLSKDILTYTGKTAKPKVTVKGSDGKKIASSNYTVSYSDKSSKKLGNYSVTVKFKGEQYSGKITKKYSISPANVTLKKTSSDKSSISVSWSKGKSNVSGYEISYSTDKNFSSKLTKTITVKSPATTTASIKKLNKKTAYYVRIRTYSTVGKQKVYSEWTKGKLVKTKAK